jgi:hypothetical protein
LLKPSALSLCHPASNNRLIRQFAASRGLPTFINHLCEFFSMKSKPVLVLVQQPDGVLQELIDASLRSALDVLAYQLLQLVQKVNGHESSLLDPDVCSAPQ